MEVEKRSSKGGFFQLFDWNVKSRKKLFSNKSELPECSNQGREKSNSSAASRPHQMKMHEIGPSTSVQERDYNCVSSVSSEEGYGAKAPGVVARLMGLESLPTSDISEPYKSPFFDSHSFRDSYIPRTRADSQSEHHIIDYDNTRNKLDGLSTNPVDFRTQKVQNRSIDRFQTEILPPKSARSISGTHRLLSPIKSPGFVLTKNAASIMEAAAKIIEQSPQSTTEGKLLSFGFPSVPLRIRDLKQKLEAAQKAPQVPDRSQRAIDNHSGKYMNRKPSEGGQRGQGGSADAQLLRQSIAPKQGGSRSSKNKEKSPSFSNQARTNVQIKEGLPPSGNRSFNQKGGNGFKPNQADKKQVYMQKSMQRRTSASGLSDVLKQNNQKQNCASSKETMLMKPQLASYQQDKKVPLTKSSNRLNKTVNKITENSSVTKKKNLVAADTGKEISLSNLKSFTGKKRRPVNGVVRNSGTAVINRNNRAVKCNVSVDDFTKCNAVDGQSGMDVVSFTFTSPIKKSLPGSDASCQFTEKDKSLLADPAGDQPNSNVSYLSSLGSNVIGSDALSVLLEQKLKELACRVEPSDTNLVKQDNLPRSASSLQDSTPHSATNSTYTEHDKKLQLSLHNHNQSHQRGYDHSSLDELMLDIKQKWQESEDLEESSNDSNENHKKTEYRGETEYQYPPPMSSQPSYSGGSCNSLDSSISYTSNGTGNRQCSSVESYETVSFISSRNPQYLEDELELSDSASSLSVGVMERKDAATTLGDRKYEQSLNWELLYIKEVLDNVDLIFEDYILYQADLIITSDVFDFLENQKTGSDKDVEAYYKLERKLIFDCLNECLEFRCERISAGSYKAAIKLNMLFQRKERLAEELYREVSGWTSMKELMVDELVDKDMSTSYGKWVDFETEEFEESSELSNDILTTLVDELVTDMLF